MWKPYNLTIGLPQTNHRHFAEVKLLMEAGNFFWWTLGEAMGSPVSKLRSDTGEPLYATIYFIEEHFPLERPLHSFTLDDRLSFFVALRTLRNTSVEGRVVFDRQERISADEKDEEWCGEESLHPWVRYGSIFATPEAGTNKLTVASPTNATAAKLPPLPFGENPARITREAETTGRLGVIPGNWALLDPAGPISVDYAIDPDRDTNAAGLVYFANYVAFMELAERQALIQPTVSGNGFANEVLAQRRVLRRRIAYYGNASLSDRLVISVSRFAPPAPSDLVGLRYRITLAGQEKPICLAEALFSFLPLASLRSRGAAAGKER